MNLLIPNVAVCMHVHSDKYFFHVFSSSSMCPGGCLCHMQWNSLQVLIRVSLSDLHVWPKSNLFFFESKWMFMPNFKKFLQGGPEITFSQEWCRRETFNHQNLISSFLNPSECLCQFGSNPLMPCLRYWVHENRMAVPKKLSLVHCGWHRSQPFARNSMRGMKKKHYRVLDHLPLLFLCILYVNIIINTVQFVRSASHELWIKKSNHSNSFILLSLLFSGCRWPQLPCAALRRLIL